MSGYNFRGKSEPEARGQNVITQVVIGGIVAPDSELATKSAALAAQAHSDVMLNHVHRTWWFGEFIGKKRQTKYDRELVYVASLLHDLGLSEHHAADKRFEVDGAHWHGKISHRFFRLHFEWPLEKDRKKLEIFYLGPKVTKS
jgi:hypothetical protein